jgi:NADH-quinone oxidoreductase subunit F
MEASHHLLRWQDLKELTTLEGHLAAGGFSALKKALATAPETVREEVAKAHLRGRGGAGFPAATKWGFVPATDGPRYLVVNADEGEPGTFKDRYLLSEDPFQLIEGCLITAWAAKLTHGVVYFRGEFKEIADAFRKAIERAREGGYLGRNILNSGLDFDLTVRLGAGAYICGEETALLESMEGRPGRPRLKPPFPAVAGAFGRPTVVNNVETLSSIPVILTMGGVAFHALGVEGDGGVKIFGLSGHVKRPGLYEFGMGKNLKELIYQEGGGILGDRELKAVIPGGSSTPVLLPNEIDIPLSFQGLQQAGSMLGTACPVVIAEGTSMVEVASRIANFYAHESCGQCTPCREGCGWIARTLKQIIDGEGTKSDIDLILSLCEGIAHRTICPFGEAVASPISAILTKFRHEFEEAIAAGGLPGH